MRITIEVDQQGRVTTDTTGEPSSTAVANAGGPPEDLLMELGPSFREPGPRDATTAIFQGDAGTEAINAGPVPTDLVETLSEPGPALVIDDIKRAGSPTNGGNALVRP